MNGYVTKEQLEGAMRYAIVAILCLLSLTARAEAQEAPRKDMVTTIICSVLLPGGGQLYAEGDATLASVALGALSIGIIMVHLDRHQPVGQTDSGVRVYKGEEDVNKMPMLIGSAIAAICWLGGVLDAPNAVRRANLSLGIVTRSRGIGVQLAIRFR